MTTTESICVEMGPYHRNNYCGLQWRDSVFAFGHLYGVYAMDTASATQIKQLRKSIISHS
jgi:hypothetical protein